MSKGIAVPIKPQVRYCGDSCAHYPRFSDLLLYELFRNLNPTEPENPCLYIKVQLNLAISLRSLSECFFKPDAGVVRVSTTIDFRDAP